MLRLYPCKNLSSVFCSRCGKTAQRRYSLTRKPLRSSAHHEPTVFPADSVGSGRRVSMYEAVTLLAVRGVQYCRSYKKAKVETYSRRFTKAVAPGPTAPACPTIYVPPTTPSCIKKIRSCGDPGCAVSLPVSSRASLKLGEHGATSEERPFRFAANATLFQTFGYVRQRAGLGCWRATRQTAV
jgi:hypothetical protein